MNIYKDINTLPSFKNAVVTIGSFDGVHLGHQQLLHKIKDLAKTVKGEDVVVTFHPHPRAVIFPNDDTLELLNTLDEKLALLRLAGVSNVVVVPFTIEFSQQSPREYIENFIIKSFSPSYLVVGYDHRFGLNRVGDYTLLKEYEQEGAFQLYKIEEQEINDITISSTKVRNYLLSGDVLEANALLGHNYSINGRVEHGEKLGHTIGYPTANIKVHAKAKLIPAWGVYAVRIMHDEVQYEGMLYIGNRPSIQKGDHVTIEVNIFNFDEVIYGCDISVEFISHIRNDIKFDSLDQLKDQLAKDKIKTLSIFEFNHPKVKNDKEKNGLVSNIAIVVLNYNGMSVLPEYLSTLKSSSSNYEYDLIVIDNASTDESIQYLYKNHEDVLVVKLDKNYGFAGGYNEGLKLINHKYIALVNSDIRGSLNWLDPIIPLFEDDENLGAIQPKVLADKRQTHFEYAGASGGFIDKLGYPYCRGRIFDTIEQDNGQYDDVAEIDWATGAAFLIRNDLFKNLGGFDSSFFAHQEEIDLCLRVKRLGYTIKVQPKSLVYHLGGGTLAYESPRKTFLNFRNNLSMILKNYNASSLFLILPLRLSLDGIAGIKFLVEGKFGNTFAIIKAHFAFYARIPSMISKRKKLVINSKESYKGYDQFKTVSVLFQYYLKSKKTFSQLFGK